MNVTRRLAIIMTAAAVVAPVGALAGSRADEKKKFIAQCDESISIARLTGAPFKFIGKKVDLHGKVGAPTADGRSFNLYTDDVETAVIVIAEARNLEGDQRVRVLGVVQKPENQSTTQGGSMTFAIVEARFVE